MQSIDLAEIQEASGSDAWKHEALFLAFLSAAALLGRGSSLLSYPTLLWALAALLAANAVLHRLRGSRPGLAGLLSIGLNSLLLAYLLDATGGCQSQLWPLFLLPIFTAGLSLPAWAMRAAGLHVAILLCFYLEPLDDGSAFAAAELVFKSGFLFFSAWVVGRLGTRERLSRRDLSRRQEELERMTRDLGDVKLQTDRTRTAVDAALHILNNKLCVILGSAQLLLVTLPQESDERKDAERIVRSAAECGVTTRRLMVEADEAGPPLAPPAAPAPHEFRP